MMPGSNLIFAPALRSLSMAGSLARQPCVMPSSMFMLLMAPCLMVSLPAEASTFFTSPSTSAVSANTSPDAIERPRLLTSIMIVLRMRALLKGCLGSPSRAASFPFSVRFGRLAVLPFGLGWRGRRRGAVAPPFVGDGTLGMLKPAGIAVVVGGEALAHLHDREHAAHFDRAERAEARHHRQRVVGRRHLHGPHLGHAARAHRMIVATHDARDLSAHVVEIDADVGVEIMPHGVHGVMALVAVQSPVPRIVRLKVEGAHRTYGDVDGGFRPARAQRYPAAVGTGH